MIKYYLTTLLLLALCSIVHAQDTLTVDSNNGELGLLNQTIAGDTTATGERVHDVYRLKRGQTYILAGDIQNRNASGIAFPLNIVAEEGNGARPRLVPGVLSSGESDRPFRARSDLTLKGLYVTGLDETGALNVAQRIIRVSADGARIEIDDCHLDHDRQAAIRVDNGNNRLLITNSVISNIGLPSNANNGRVIDDRANDIDTVIMENNTFYNISSTLMNGNGGWIQYAKINQNTIVHVGRRIFDFEETQTAIFTNNLVINPGFFGIQDDPAFADLHGSVEIDLLEIDSLSTQTISELPDVAQTFTFSNNNIAWNTEVVEAWPEDPSSYAGTDFPIIQRTITNATGEALAGETQLASNIVEIVSFENQPPINDLAVIIDQFWADPNFNDDKSSVKPWDISAEPFDFSYGNNFFSTVASTENGPLGSPQWMVSVVCNDFSTLTETLPQEVEVYFNNSGVATLSEAQLIGDLELCDRTTLSFTPSTFQYSANQGNLTTELTVVEGQNTFTNNISVVLLDTIAPTITAGETASLFVNESGNVEISAESLLASATDNTEIDRVFVNEILDCTNLGASSFYVYAEDVFDNIDSILVNVNVIDDTAPTFEANSEISIEIVDQTPIEVISSMIFDSVADNCEDELQFSFTPAILGCDLFRNEEITFTIEDASGNQASGSVQILLSGDDCIPLSTDSYDRQLKLYPLPITNTLSLQIPDFPTSDVNISVMDLGGRRVSIPRSYGNGLHSLDFSNSKPGVYLLMIETGKERMIRKVIKSPN